MYFWTWCCQHVCSVYLGCIYWQPTQPTDDFFLNNLFHIFRSKNKGCIYKNGHSYFLQGFQQSRPFIHWTLMSKLIQKTQTKSIACRVRFNPFYRALEPVDPWLCPIVKMLKLLTSAWTSTKLHSTISWREGSLCGFRHSLINNFCGLTSIVWQSVGHFISSSFSLKSKTHSWPQVYSSKWKSHGTSQRVSWDNVDILVRETICSDRKYWQKYSYIKSLNILHFESY